VVIEGGPPGRDTGDADLAERLVSALQSAGVEGRRAAQVISAVTGMSRNESYRLAMEAAR
jgi:hypothetical protein